LTQLVALVSAPLRDLHGLIDARIKQLEEQGEVVSPDATTEEAESEEAPDTQEADPGKSASADSPVKEEE